MNMYEDMFLLLVELVKIKRDDMNREYFMQNRNEIKKRLGQQNVTDRGVSG